MKTNNSYFYNPSFGLGILVIVTLLVTAAGALSIVWMRQQITKTAYRCQALELELRNVERKNTFLASKIAQAHNPEFLKTYRNHHLQAPTKNQIVHVHTPKVMEAVHPIMPDQKPFMIAFNLALIQDNR